MNKLYSFIVLAMILLGCGNANAAVEVIKTQGWFEGGFVTWTKVAGTSYNVYVAEANSSSWTKLDNALVREYPTYGRADAVGLKAGQYKFKVVPVVNNAEATADATETSAFTATAYDRGGFAHFKTASSTFNPANGVGAYKNDGTLKAGAKVIYVYADNAKTITTDVVTNSKGGTTKGVGFQDIINLYQKGYDKTPIDFRIIGTIKAADMDAFGSSAEGLQIKGNKSYSEMNITIEGIGNDATIHGFGFLLRNACSVELRNFAIMWCMDDAVSMDTDNGNLWIHNLDLFYGKPGGAADQKKGDGTLDIKGDSKYCTLSYNHLWDSGKSSLCGMKSESGPNYLTYHHNWFDHSDSRHPRIRTMSVHVYNNYYDGNAKYGIGATTGSDVFAENNYYRNCKYPMLTSKQGSDVHNGQGSSDETKGTFSGEAGGSIKAFGNYMTGQRSFEPYKAGDATYSKHFDAYVVSSRDEKVPASVVALLGGDTYSNFDTDASLMYSGYKCDAAADVPAIVKGDLGAGRCQHGDFSWTFGANEDNNDQVITALSNAINAYKSTLVGFFGQTISNGGATTEQGGGSNEGTEGGGTGGSDIDDSDDDNTLQEEAYIAGETEDDYFFFNKENADKVNAYLADGTITLGHSTVAEAPESAFTPDYTYDAVANGKTFASTVYTGSINLGKASAAGASDGGYAIFRCDKGVTTFAAYFYRTGSVYLKLYTSTDGKSWKEVTKVEKGDAGIFTKNFTSFVVDKDHCVFIKMLNTSTGGLNIQGVRILNEKGATVKEPSESTGGETGGNTGGETGGNTGGGTGDNASVCHFSDKAPSSTQVTVSGNYSDSKGKVSYNGTDYSICVKMESATNITIKPSADGEITLVFGGSEGGKKLKLNGETCVTDVNGKYTFTATAGTTYALTKGDAINLFLMLFSNGGGSSEGGNTGGNEDDNPGGGHGGSDTPGGNTSGTLIDYPTSKTGIGIQGSSAESGSTIQLKNGFIGTVNGVANTPGNGIKLTIDGGFKAGDVITIAGTITVDPSKDTGDAYTKKINTTACVVTVEGDVASEPIYTFANFGNVKESGVGNSGEQTYTLEADYPELWIVRSGATTATITKLSVSRGVSTGIRKVISEVNATVYDLQGRRITVPAKGQIYIQNGKKYVGE